LFKLERQYLLITGRLKGRQCDASQVTRLQMTFSLG
jgi:hypothetical protein